MVDAQNLWSQDWWHLSLHHRRLSLGRLDNLMCSAAATSSLLGCDRKNLGRWRGWSEQREIYMRDFSVRRNHDANMQPQPQYCTNHGAVQNEGDNIGRLRALV